MWHNKLWKALSTEEYRRYINIIIIIIIIIKLENVYENLSSTIQTSETAPDFAFTLKQIQVQYKSKFYF